MSRFSSLAVLCSIHLALTFPSFTQMADPIASSQAPMPGSDHHYIGIGAETVNPADGSLSFDLPINPPGGRGLSMPFGISYISSDFAHPYANGQFSSGGFLVLWQGNTTIGSQETGGWSYLLPSLSFSTYSIQTELGQPPRWPANTPHLL